MAKGTKVTKVAKNVTEKKNCGTTNVALVSKMFSKKFVSNRAKYVKKGIQMKIVLEVTN